MKNQTKLCLAVSKTFNYSQIEQIQKFKNHNIDGFFAVYENDKQTFELADFASKTGMFFQSIHANYYAMREMWYDGEQTNYIMEQLKSTIKCASECGVDRVILHLYTGFLQEQPTLLGLKRAGELLETAQKYKVKMCFENLEGTQFLDAVLDEYKDCEYARMCYDTGHENCYGTHAVVEKYIDRISALHINDNFGIRSKEKTLTGKDDLHLLPFDGNVDFERAGKIIRQANMQNELTFELKISNDPFSERYKNLDFDSYLTLAKQRMDKLKDLITSQSLN